MLRLQHAILLILLISMFGLAALAVRSSQQTSSPSYRERAEETEGGDREKEKRKSFWEKTADDPVATFTGVLVLFTAVLAAVSVVQIRFLVRADDTARIAATAAKRSADALMSLERPWLVAIVDEVMLGDRLESALEGDPIDFEVELRFVNEGRTTAFLEVFHAEAAVASYPKPAKGRRFEIKNEGQAVGPGKEVSFPLGFGLVIDRKTAITILEGDAVIWLFGYLEYADFLREDRRTYFCFNHNMGVGCVAPWGGKKENSMT